MPTHFEPTIEHFCQSKRQRGASMIEALIAIPIIVVACLLALQVMLLYRAKISLNYATQEAARIGSSSNGRIYPRFVPGLSDFIAMGGKSRTQKPALPAGSTAASEGHRPTGAALEAGSSGSTASAQAPPSTPARTAKPSTNYLQLVGKGLLQYGDSSVLQGFINGMVPFYTTGTGFGDIVKGQVSAYGDAMMHSCILYHNPTQSAFLDFGYVDLEGPDKYIYKIPNDLMRYRVPSDVDPAGKGIGYYKKHGKYLSDETEGLNGGVSAMSVQDANLLSIEIKYSAKMKVPIAREIIVGISKLYNSMVDNETWLGKRFVESALAHGRWPMSSVATYRMRSPVHWSVLFPFGTAAVESKSASEINVRQLIKLLWNSVFDLIPLGADGKPKWDPADPQLGFCPGLIIEAIGINKGPTTDTCKWFMSDYDKKKAGVDPSACTAPPGQAPLELPEPEPEPTEPTRPTPPPPPPPEEDDPYANSWVYL